MRSSDCGAQGHRRSREAGRSIGRTVRERRAVVLDRRADRAVGRGVRAEGGRAAHAGAPQVSRVRVPGAGDDVPRRRRRSSTRPPGRTLQAGDVRGAERRFAALLKRAPEFYPAQAGLGYVALARDNMKAALGHFDRALALNGTYAPALAGKGQAHLALERARAGARQFRCGAGGGSGAEPASAAPPTCFASRFCRAASRRPGRRPSRPVSRGARRLRGRHPGLAAEPVPLSRAGDGRVPRRRSWTRLRSGSRRRSRSNRTTRGIMSSWPTSSKPRGTPSAALQSLTKAVALEPSEALDRRIEGLREKAALAALPPEYPRHRDRRDDHPRAARGADRRPARGAREARAAPRRRRHHRHARTGRLRGSCRSPRPASWRSIRTTPSSRAPSFGAATSRRRPAGS